MEFVTLFEDLHVLVVIRAVAVLDLLALVALKGGDIELLHLGLDITWGGRGREGERERERERRGKSEKITMMQQFTCG